ncbi:MAG TPA: ATP-binding protein [Syntrophales bacterium]|nr:ATP-binding protein [Syntrophales bacterium]
MKKRFVLGLAIFTSIFLLGGIYLIITIEKATSSLNNLIELHQVEILREKLLIDAKDVQSRLALQRTRFAGTLNAVVKDVAKLKNQADRCLECHHTMAITERLQDLKAQISAYSSDLNSLFTIGTNETRLKEDEKKAFEAGRKLVNQLDDMISLTKARLEKGTQATLKKISDMKTLIFIVIALGPIFAISLVIFFMRGLTVPLAALLQATRELKSGDLSFRVQNLTGEFGEMAAAFNEMAAALNEQIHKMQRAEQMTLVGEMAASLVHEIKNPLAGIKATMYLFQEEAEIREEERAILSQAIDEVKRIETLMKSLLNFAKPPKLEFLSVNMNDILDGAFSLALPFTHSTPNSAKAIRIEKQFDPHLPLIMADPMVMQQVFLNILMNALQAMPNGGTLTAMTCATALDEEIQIEITDTGKGIRDEVRGKIFQPFFTTKSKGTGLGLAISKQFVEKHGGTITAENNPLGGAIFRIILPCNQNY